MILVTGVNGQLGFDVVKELNGRGIDNKGIDIEDLDLTKESEVLNFIKNLEPKCVIHCAGYTNVDKAELKESEIKKCFNSNYKATEYLAKACKLLNIKMIYISTDYVFDGSKIGEYEIIDDINPLSNYGKSKAEGEQAVLKHVNKYVIIRTSWLFGANGKNFVNTIIEVGKKKQSLNVVCDQIGSPTYTVDLACFICETIDTTKYGTYHATNEGFCSWADLAKKVLEIKGIDCKINFVTTNEYKAIAKRPLNSKLSKKSLIENGFKLLPHWEDALKRYLLSTQQ